MWPSRVSVSNPLATFLAGTHYGPPLHLGDITVVPLLGDTPEIEAELLEEALAQGHTTVTEVSEGGGREQRSVT